MKVPTPGLGGSHRGNVWELMIRSVISILLSMLHCHRLTDDSLSTILTLRILTFRPLTKLSDNPADLNCLTPNRILLVSRNDALLINETVDSNSKLRWKAILSCAKEFWARWKKEYVSPRDAKLASEGTKFLSWRFCATCRKHCRSWLLESQCCN